MDLTYQSPRHGCQTDYLQMDTLSSIGVRIAVIFRRFGSFDSKEKEHIIYLALPRGIWLRNAKMTNSAFFYINDFMSFFKETTIFRKSENNY